ncbi:helix-turn-helix domain-containing protein [Streptomyces resistomycificus]|uniref:XRE family transcriptional regulator n=1 Tax=Streptomyces resistomycificus TaxID=67356 RepID=A0A0L8KTS5_9ACTN|nr:XRE family transcriptional regulator [Streptomyces resistomycificus]KOG29302.1 XRE family transcriptional regulator [Streptomyces resistomycificus]KUO01634.1 XRE family transcriptional regulator [Streptomyces resistomycificus]
MNSSAAEPGPTAGPDEVVPAVAPQLRALRRRASLTLEAAARAAGLSPAHLSRLETGQRQPSLPMLLGLARVYGTTVSELLGETAPGRDAVVRADDMEPTAAGGWTYWPAGAPGRGMQALRVHVPYGSQGDIVRVHPGEEWLYVLEGRLRLRLADTTHLLAARDSAHFDSLTPHRIVAEDRGGVELLFVHTLLQSPTATLCLGPTPGDTP